MDGEIVYTKEEIQAYTETPVILKIGDIFIGRESVENYSGFLWNVTTSEKEFIDVLSDTFGRTNAKDCWREPFYSMFFIKPLSDMPLYINDPRVSHIAIWRLKIGR